MRLHTHTHAHTHSHAHTHAGASTLGKDDVEKMVADAERFAGEDKKKREAVDTKNQAESMIYQTEKQLEEFKEKVPEDVKVSRGGGVQGVGGGVLLTVALTTCAGPCCRLFRW